MFIKHIKLRDRSAVLAALSGVALGLLAILAGAMWGWILAGGK